MSTITSAKDLTKVAPRSANERLGGFAIIARTIDKCRADIAGTVGEYHFNCPVDRMIFDWKGTDAQAFRDLAATDANDDALVQFVKDTGTPKTDEEIAAWSDEVCAVNLSDSPEKGQWFKGECERLGLDPAVTTLFDMLDEDDRVSYAQ